MIHFFPSIHCQSMAKYAYCHNVDYTYKIWVKEEQSIYVIAFIADIFIMFTLYSPDILDCNISKQSHHTKMKKWDQGYQNMFNCLRWVWVHHYSARNSRISTSAWAIYNSKCCKGCKRSVHDSRDYVNLSEKSARLVFHCKTSKEC